MWSLHCCRLAMAVVYKPNVVAEGRGNSTPLALSSACGSPLRDQRKQTILSESLSLLKGLSQLKRSYIFKSNYIHCFSSVHKGRSFFFSGWRSHIAFSPQVSTLKFWKSVSGFLCSSCHWHFWRVRDSWFCKVPFNLDLPDISQWLDSGFAFVC